jgi:hypothetical protein
MALATLVYRHHNAEVARVETGVAAALAGHLVNAPAIRPRPASIVRQRLKPRPSACPARAP